MPMLHVTTAEAALAVSGLAGLGGLANALRLTRWQRQRDRERRETRLKFAFEHSSRRLDGKQPWIVASAPQPPPRATEYRLRVVVVNVSETSTVWVREIDIEQAIGEEGVKLTHNGDGATRLEPGEPLVLDFFPQRYEIDFANAGVRVRAHLAPDRWITSKVEHLLDDLFERSTGPTTTYVGDKD